MEGLYLFGIPVLWYRLESSVLNALRSSNQLENCSIFDRLPKVHDYNGIPDLVPYPDNDDDCFLPTELGKNSLSSVVDRPNTPNEGALLLSALNAYQLNKLELLCMSEV